MRKIVVTLLLLLMPQGLGLFVGISKAATIIFILSDGNIDPPTVPILRSGEVYSFSNDIYAEIVVQRSNIIIDGSNFKLQGDRTLNSTGIYLSNVSNVVVKRVHVTEFFCAIKIANSKSCTITENNVTNSDFGLWIEYSTENIVSKNNLENLWCGVNVAYSHKTQIFDNALSISEYGIILDWSAENVVAQNNFTDNGSSINLAWSKNNAVIGNLVIGKAKNSWQGIRLHSSSNNTILENRIESTLYALRLLYDTTENTIRNNNISSNIYGVITWYASNNTIYHNRFVGNNEQAKCYASSNWWDSGYPSGGNYWSNYAGVDEKSGANQDQPGSDGIGDTPYIIDDKNVDNYPLVGSQVKQGSPETLIFFYILIAILATLIIAFPFALYKRKSQHKQIL
ncbi:MAG: NosD domain-containing protein [Candidatus Bathyarchaeota archaeon]|nr:NosD domain-containing protein [Candidatus Bathyarchaeota archaeon]